jgi:hypothetical protein
MMNHQHLLRAMFHHRLGIHTVGLLVMWPALLHAELKTWSLASPDRRAGISVSLSDEGRLSYQVTRAGRIVVQTSPLGLIRDDRSFDHGLHFKRADDPVKSREQYELFAGIMPRVDRQLIRRSVEFRNGDNEELILDLAASDEGVAFRYRFPGQSTDARVVRAELTGFQIPTGARGWLQPYHAASDYTPAYEDFFYQVAPGDPPPRSRQQPRGWCFPALFGPDAIREVSKARAHRRREERQSRSCFETRRASHLVATRGPATWRVHFAA